MNGLYTETYVKVKKSPLLSLVKPLLIVIGIAVVLLGFMGIAGLGFLFVVVGGGIIFAAVCLSPLLNVDYEYIFCDGQIDFDRISGGEKRKTVLKLDMDNIEIMAPEKSHQLDSYNHMEGITVKDFSSKIADHKKYSIFLSNEGKKLLVIFEPSEKMVEFAKQKAPRKVFTD